MSLIIQGPTIREMPFRQIKIAVLHSTLSDSEETAAARSLNLSEADA
jgi:hypothetical protein